MNGISTYCANGDHFLLCHIKLKEQTVEAKKYSLKSPKQSLIKRYNYTLTHQLIQIANCNQITLILTRILSTISFCKKINTG